MKSALLLLGLLIGLSGCSNQNPYKIQSSIVRLHDAATGSFFCSGTVIGPNTVLTASHCVLRETMFGYMPVMPQSVEIRDSNGKVLNIFVQDFKAHPGTDVAILKADVKNFPVAKFSISPKFITKAVSSYGPITACGFPYGGPMFCTGFEYKSNHIFMFQGSGHAWPGMSGGPVFDSNGVIIAVISAANERNIIVAPLINMLYYFNEAK